MILNQVTVFTPITLWYITKWQCLHQYLVIHNQVTVFTPILSDTIASDSVYTNTFWYYCKWQCLHQYLLILNQVTVITPILCDTKSSDRILSIPSNAKPSDRSFKAFWSQTKRFQSHFALLSQTMWHNFHSKALWCQNDRIFNQYLVAQNQMTEFSINTLWRKIKWQNFQSIPCGTKSNDRIFNQYLVAQNQITEFSINTLWHKIK